MTRTIKKSIIIAIICLLLCCTAVVSAAKYFSTDDNTQNGQVSKWGVTFTPGANAFTSSVKEDDKFIIKATGDYNVIAPGSTGTITSLSISGTPEVAVEVVYTATVTLTGWTTTGSDEYCPLVFTAGSSTIKLGEGAATTIDKLEEEIAKALSFSQKYDAGTDLSSVTVPSVSYEWEFYVDNETDAKDTALGNASTAPTISIELVASVTQINSFKSN